MSVVVQDAHRFRADRPWGARDLVEIGDEHVTYPRGEARILVIERKGSV